MRVTRPNLLCWYNSDPDPDKLPRPLNDCRTGSLITFPGEEFSFYLNALVPAQRNNLSSVSIVSVIPGGPSHTVQNGVTTDAVRDGETTVYGSLTCPDMPPGLYRYRLQFGADVLFSTVIEIADEETARACSIAISCRHPVSMQGVRYPWVDPLFAQAYRIRALLVDAPPQAEMTAYREATTGITVPYNTAFDQILRFQVPMTDADILQGLAVTLLHEQLYINNRPVSTKDMLTTSPGRAGLATGSFSVIDNSIADALQPA